VYIIILVIINPRHHNLLKLMGKHHGTRDSETHMLAKLRSRDAVDFMFAGGVWGKQNQLRLGKDIMFAKLNGVCVV
jgi:hypothetical protein